MTPQAPTKAHATMTRRPLPRPDLSGLGTAYWARQKILNAAEGFLTAAELADDEFTGTCHCGKCRGFPRCKFIEPRNHAEVMWNVRRTGWKSGGRIAEVAKILSHFDDDIVLALGIGAGTCVAGWEFARGAPIGRIFGVEIEPLAIQVARAAFPAAQIHQTITTVSLPSTGRLVVLSGLVMNLVDSATAYCWGEAAAKHCGEIVWIDVGREFDRNSLPHALAAFRAVGREGTQVALPASINEIEPLYRTTCWRFV